MLSIKRIFSPMSFGKVAWIIFAIAFAAILYLQLKRGKGGQFLRAASP